MRLTLRTLLAYLDDTLGPVEAKEIGLKVAENHQAQELVARIRQVTRRRRLTTPEMAPGAGGQVVDGNTVAEYLDNALSDDDVAELEKLCLESDVHLAEVAACHQILTVILGEPAQVPPTARQRMYGLVRGRESIPHRRPPAAHVAASDDEEVGHGTDERESTLLMGLPSYHKSTPLGRRLLPVAAALILLAGLAAVIYIGVGQGTKHSGTGPAPLASAPDTKPAVPATKTQAPPVPVATHSIFGKVQQEPVLLIGTETALLAARPMFPSNFFLIGLAKEESIAAPVVTDVPPPDVPVKPAIAPGSTNRVLVAQHATAAAKDSMLLRRTTDNDWRIIKPLTRVSSGEVLVTLPGYRSELALDSKLRLELVGNLPDSPQNVILEAAAQLHENRLVDLDITLYRGRFIIANKAKGVGTVRLRFVDQVWDVHLMQPASEIGIEFAGRVTPGDNDFNPHWRLMMVTTGGDVDLKYGDKLEHVPAKRTVFWNSGNPAGVLIDPANVIPPWLGKKNTFPEEIRTASANFQKRIIDKLTTDEPELPWIKVACEEALATNRPWERFLALFTLGAVEQLPPLIKAMDDEDQFIRRAASDAVTWWLGTHKDQLATIRSALKGRGFSETDADLLLQMLKGYAQADRDTVDLLLKTLNHESLPLREAAHVNLFMLFPRDRLMGYDPAAPAEIRTKAVDMLRTRLLPKK